LNSSESTGLVRASNGEWNVLSDGRPLYSKFAPSDSAERLSREAPAIEFCIYIIPSPLLGYGILSFINRIPETSAVIGLEVDQSLMALSKDFQTELAAGLPKNKYRSFRTGSTAQLYQVFKMVQTGDFRKCHLVPLNAGYRHNKEKYDSLFSTFQHFIKNYWQNRLTLARMAPLWIRNLTENLPLLKRPDIAGFRTEKPILLTGAGESLEESIPLIQKNRERVYLLSVDTAVQSLVRNGIVPDGIVNLEAQFYNLQDFYSIISNRIDLFSDITAYPPTLRPQNFNHYIFMSSFAETSLHRRLGEAGMLPTEIPPLGSVGVTALFLASLLTDRQIFLSGLDFSYTEGKTHARETPFHDYCRLRENRLTGDVWLDFSLSRPSYRAEGKTEGTVTNSILESYCRQLEDLSRSMNGRVFDLGRKGLRMTVPPLDHEGFHTLTAGSAGEIPTGVKEEIKPSGADSPDQILTSFIELERRRLEELIAVWEKICAGSADTETILPLLGECDYLYFHFPDRKILPNTDPAFLVRVIREARVLLRKIR